MRKLLLAGLLASCAFAQGMTEVPPLIQVVRKPGIAAAAPRTYGDARAQVNVFGLAAVTGLPETWMVEAHYSFASIEELDKNLNAVAPLRSSNAASDLMQDDVLAPARTMIARFRPEWSYRPDQAIRLFARARYFFVTIYRVRGGTEAEFAEQVRLRRAALDSVNLDRPDIAYQVFSGAPSGTYVFLSPVVTLKTLDDGVPDPPAYAQHVVDANAKAKATSSVSDIGREHLLFRVEPRLSYVSDDFAGVDSDFWRPKN